ncbi:MAG TPA: UDP-N-acetylglucosamine 2-epimerase [Ramlibacter sp.]|uniref:UDP-N-acetylglucosamine 2-epimerase n=1 Tax=Ramlibacter sp. TaxID=1917967 RepID=UPI002C861C2B|nr:UDP-N-acetylglucosamine 2-epimerase [Ramlibacter sp.]HVZ45352.1 UDP-N-acetylglucosamine 2-epimerase [Ramlibacter sp.]
MKKILGLTSIRSDYDLLSGVYTLLAREPGVDFRLLVAGTHLSANHGHTIDMVRADGLPILAEIESLIDGDAPRSRAKSAGIFLQSACDAVASWAPDLFIFAGDREDALMAAALGAYLQVPTVHFFGGDHEQDGHADTAARHAISKLATAHVVATDEQRRRLRAMGESAHRIVVAGSVALDRFVAHRAPTPTELKQLLPPDKSLDGYALLIFHPVDAEREHAGEQFETILRQLRDRGIPVCASYPNTDPGNASIRNAMAKYEHEPDCWFFHNLAREPFLSVYKSASFLIGNSSSGILEAASIPLPVVNVGLRQRGRAAGANVVFCDADAQSIGDAIDGVRSEAFRAGIAGMENPYGRGDSCRRAVRFLLETDFAAIRAKIEDPLTLTNPNERTPGAGH